MIAITKRKKGAKRMNLSPSFTLEEMVLSDTATRLGLQNKPSQLAFENLMALCSNVLEPAHTELGALRILSGYRSPELNAAVGGARDSQHTLGQAADILPLDVTRVSAFAWFRRAGQFDQLIREFPPEGWIHVSWAQPARHVVLLAERVDGTTRYTRL